MILMVLRQVFKLNPCMDWGSSYIPRSLIKHMADFIRRERCIASIVAKHLFTANIQWPRHHAMKPLQFVKLLP